MLDSLVQLIQHNAVLSGGLAIGAAGGIFAGLRSVPERVVELAKRQLLVTVEIRSTSPLYWWLLDWIDKQDFTRASRAISASVDYRREEDARIIFTPAPGDHLIRYRGKRIWFSRHRNENKAWGAIDETLTLTMLGRDQRVVRALLDDVERIALSDDGYVRVWVPQGDGWEELAKKRPRPIASVILVEGEAERIVDDLRTFYNERDWYTGRGLPHRRGYLLYGPPGTGKSSLAHAIAGEVGKDLYVVNLSGPDMSDKRLATQMMRVPENGITLIEDVDAAFVQREKAQKTDSADGITFSGLLNAIDGVSARDGQVVIMSTNHVDRLDPALIRPGRVDYRLFLDNATRDQAARLFRRFFPDGRDELVGRFAEAAGDGRFSMAALQNHLLTWRRDAQLAMLAIEQLAPERSERSPALTA